MTVWKTGTVRLGGPPLELKACISCQRCVWKEIHNTYSLAFNLTGYRFCSLYDLVCMSRGTLPKCRIDGPGSSAKLEPCCHFFSAQEAKLLFEVKLVTEISAVIRRNNKLKHTSGSVKARPIDIIPDTRIPSVKIGPRKLCILGVRRKGTTSLEA